MCVCACVCARTRAEMMALRSAKPTKFSFPLCCSFPVASSKSYMATNYAPNIQPAPFCQPWVVSFTCTMVLRS